MIIGLIVSWVIISREYKDIVFSGVSSPLLTATLTHVSTSQPSPTDDVSVAVKPTIESPTILASPIIICVHTVTYWANHSELWPAQVTIAGFSYISGDLTTLINTQSWDLPAILLVQLHAAYLNYLNGEKSDEVAQTLIDTANWLSTHPVDSEISAPDLQAGVNLGTALADYNNGRLRYGACEDEPAPMQINEIFLPEETAPATVVAAPTRKPKVPTSTRTPGEPRPRKLPDTTAVPPPPTHTPAPPPSPVPTQEPLPTPAPTTGI